MGISRVLRASTRKELQGSSAACGFVGGWVGFRHMESMRSLIS